MLPQCLQFRLQRFVISKTASGDGDSSADGPGAGRGLPAANVLIPLHAFFFTGSRGGSSAFGAVAFVIDHPVGLPRVAAFCAGMGSLYRRRTVDAGKIFFYVGRFPHRRPAISAVFIPVDIIFPAVCANLAHWRFHVSVPPFSCLSVIQFCKKQFLPASYYLILFGFFRAPQKLKFFKSFFKILIFFICRAWNKKMTKMTF